MNHSFRKFIPSVSKFVRITKAEARHFVLITMQYELNKLRYRVWQAELIARNAQRTSRPKKVRHMVKAA